MLTHQADGPPMTMRAGYPGYYYPLAPQHFPYRSSAYPSVAFFPFDGIIPFHMKALSPFTLARFIADRSFLAR